MKFIDLNIQYQLNRQAIDHAISTVLSHGQYIMGPEVFELEKQLAAFVGVKHCICCSSGTTALQIALMALGIGHGDEVITTPFSFFATAEIIILLGAKPIFVDIDPRTYNIDINKLEAAITEKTKLILPVSMFGQCPDFSAINAIALKYNLPVVEDGAQSFGATHLGKPSCSFTKIACTSFFPSKPLGCYGDGGACFTDDDRLAQKMRELVNHGQHGRYNHISIGMNGRFDSLQAAVLLAKLPKFQAEIAKRQQIASWYDEALAGHIETPYIASANKSVYAQYTIQIDDRDEVAKQLQAVGIPTAVHYPKPLHHQPAIAPYVDSQQQHPHAQRICNRVLSLPFHPYMDQNTVAQIADQLISITVA